MGKRLVYNTALLTGSSLLMRCIGMAFQAWLAGRIGATGIGLFQLVMSVEMLCTTLAVSGIRFAATRIVAEEIGSGREGAVGTAVFRCCMYSLLFGCTAAAVLMSFAEPIGFLWIGDARTVMSLRILACGLPFLSLSSVLSGYFTACGRVWKSSLVHLIEQLSYVALVALFLYHAPDGDIERNCAAVTAGITASDMLSFALMFALFLGDRRAHPAGSARSERLTIRMLGVALPLAVSSYARSALSTLEHMLVPRGLRRSGLSADSALAGYGVIQGMAMPLISFPASLLMAVSELIVPELTEAQMRGDGALIRRAVKQLIKKSLLFSSACAILLFSLADVLSAAVYGTDEAAAYIRLLAPLVPVMYTDMVVDGCLKGLGQQVWSMGINIFDAALGAALVWLLLPVGALDAYIGIIYADELINFAMSAARLRSVCRRFS